MSVKKGNMQKLENSLNEKRLTQEPLAGGFGIELLIQFDPMPDVAAVVFDTGGIKEYVSFACSRLV